MQLSLLAPRGIAQGSAASRTSCFSYCSSSRPQACRLQLRRSFCGGARLRQEVSNGAKCSAFFKLGGQTSAGGGYCATAIGSGILCEGHLGLRGTRTEFQFGILFGVYGAQKRDDYTSDDVEQYFNYMGMLAEQGSYDGLEKVLASNIHPADVLLQWAAGEGDTPKTAELLRAGADPNAKNQDGQVPAELTKDEEILAMLKDPSKADSFEQE